MRFIIDLSLSSKMTFLSCFNYVILKGKEKRMGEENSLKRYWRNETVWTATKYAAYVVLGKHQ